MTGSDDLMKQIGETVKAATTEGLAEAAAKAGNQMAYTKESIMGHGHCDAEDCGLCNVMDSRYKDGLRHGIKLERKNPGGFDLDG